MRTFPTTVALDDTSGDSSQITTWALRLSVGLVSLNVIMLLASLVAGGAWRLLITSMFFTTACTVVMANLIAISAGRAGRLPHAAATITCLSLALAVGRVWTDQFPFETETFWKLMFIGLTTGVAATYAAMLTVPQLSGKWVHAVDLGFAAVALLAVIISAALIFESSAAVSFSVLPTGMLLVATILVVLGNRVAKRELEAAELIDLTAPAPNVELYDRVAYCPLCGAALGVEPAWGPHHECGRCRAGFRIQITQRREVF